MGPRFDVSDEVPRGAEAAGPWPHFDYKGLIVLRSLTLWS